MNFGREKRSNAREMTMPCGARMEQEERYRSTPSGLRGRCATETTSDRMSTLIESSQYTWGSPEDAPSCCLSRGRCHLQPRHELFDDFFRRRERHWAQKTGNKTFGHDKERPNTTLNRDRLCWRTQHIFLVGVKWVLLQPENKDHRNIYFETHNLCSCDHV